MSVLKLPVSTGFIHNAVKKYAGKLEHRNEIADGAMTQKKVENLAELKKPYLHIGE